MKSAMRDSRQKGGSKWRGLSHKKIAVTEEDIVPKHRKRLTTSHASARSRLFGLCDRVRASRKQPATMVSLLGRSSAMSGQRLFKTDQVDAFAPPRMTVSSATSKFQGSMVDRET